MSALICVGPYHLSNISLVKTVALELSVPGMNLERNIQTIAKKDFKFLLLQLCRWQDVA